MSEGRRFYVIPDVGERQNIFKANITFIAQVNEMEIT